LQSITFAIILNTRFMMPTKSSTEEMIACNFCQSAIQRYNLFKIAVFMTLLVLVINLWWKINANSQKRTAARQKREQWDIIEHTSCEPQGHKKMTKPMNSFYQPTKCKCPVLKKIKIFFCILYRNSTSAKWSM